MTVRTWFRLQRAALWARDDGVAAAVDRLTTAAIEGTTLPTYMYIGDGTHALVFDLPTYLNRRRIIDAISTDMQRRTRHWGNLPS